MLDVVAGAGFTAYFRLFTYITSVAKEGRGGKRKVRNLLRFTTHTDSLSCNSRQCRPGRVQARGIFNMQELGVQTKSQSPLCLEFQIKSEQVHRLLPRTC